MLEDEVDEKYYLSDKMIKYISFSGTKDFKLNDSKINLDVARPITTDNNKRAGTSNYLCNDLPKNFDLNELQVADYRYDEGLRIRKNGMSPTLTRKCGDGSVSGKPLLIKNNKVNKTGYIEKGTGEHQSNQLYDLNGLSPALCRADYKSPLKFLIKNNTKKGYLEAEEGDGVYTNTTTKRGTVQKNVSPALTSFQDKGVVVKDEINVIGNYSPSNHDASRIVDSDGLAPTVKENHGTVTATNCDLRIRKLTPKECWRLMGFDDSDFDKAAKVNSNSQLYKQAGNSIVVNVLEKILKNLLLD